eukprot:2275147-Alexandrium_andersonii.AAC.1
MERGISFRTDYSAGCHAAEVSDCSVFCVAAEAAENEEEEEEEEKEEEEEDEEEMAIGGVSAARR